VNLLFDKFSDVNLTCLKLKETRNRHGEC